MERDGKSFHSRVFSHFLHPEVEFVDNWDQRTIVTNIKVNCCLPRNSDVHCHLRAGTHRRLDRAMERNDQKPRPQGRAPPAPAPHRAAAAGFSGD